MEKVKKPFYKRWWFITFCALLLIGMIFGPSEEERAEQEAVAAAEAEKEQAEKEARKKKQQEAKAKAKAEADAKKAEEKKVKEAEVAKEKEEAEALIALFQVAAAEMVANSEGVIADATIAYNTNHFAVKVYVDELTWAVSNDSEKESFATTVGTAVENALSPHITYVDIVSATNNDVVATQKMFGGWKIKR